MKYQFASLVFLLAGSGALAAQTPESAPAGAQSPASRFQEIENEFKKAQNEFQKKYSAAKTDADREAALANYPSPAKYSRELFEIAVTAKGEPTGAKALKFVLQGSGDDATTRQAVAIIQEHYVMNPEVGDLLSALSRQRTESAYQLLESVVTKNPNRTAKAKASYFWAQQQQYVADLARKLAAGDKNAWTGGADLDWVRRQDAAKLEKSADALLETAEREYKDVYLYDFPGYKKTVSEAAGGELFEARNLAIGKVAPDIEGKDLIGQPMKLSQYRGKVVVLDFWGNW